MIRLQKRSMDYLRDQLGLRLDQPGDDEFMPVLADGVYLNLPEELYFGQDALGSTDLADLWLYREGWWWKSRHNPRRKRDDSSKAKLFGSAAHTMLLEGLPAFNERWAVEPDPLAFPELLTTRDEVYSALDAIGAPGLRPTLRNKDLFDLGGVYLPERHIWPLILERFERTVRDKDKISAEDKWVLDVMREAVLNDDQIGVVLSTEDCVPLAEVSVFWTLSDGTRLRFRVDRLLPNINVDLKTIGNVRDRDLGVGVGKRIGQSALDVQAAMSFEARRVLYSYLKQGGALHGGTKRQRTEIMCYPEGAPIDKDGQPNWRWLWMFYQKPDAEGHAPVVFPVWMRFGSTEHKDGWDKALTALRFYRETVAAKGLTKPWTKVETSHFYDGGAAKQRIESPSWIERPIHVPGSEAAMNWRDPAPQLS